MIEMIKVSKTYLDRSHRVTALESIDLRINTGEFILVCGPSGSGKSTLLLTLGGMLNPSQGSVQFEGRDLYHATEKERTRFRSQHIGFVFQMFNLLPYLNVLDNVLLGALPKTAQGEKAARTFLEQVNLGDRLHHKPAELSVGECQRVAMVRALCKNPKLLLADEPTGNLDMENAAAILALLTEYRRQGGTVVMVTHGPVEQIGADRILYLKNGKNI
jgi:putative ABC transport system ATP-binding protein